MQHSREKEIRPRTPVPTSVTMHHGRTSMDHHGSVQSGHGRQDDAHSAGHHGMGDGGTVHRHCHDHAHHHAHDAHDHHHHHHHPYAPVYTPALPTLSQLLTQLSPQQKTLLTWAALHASIATLLWWCGQSVERLAITSVGYMGLFDAVGILVLLCQAMVTRADFGYTNLKRPFGAQRLDILASLLAVIYLLFSAMFITKEAIEHVMLEEAGESAGVGHEDRRQVEVCHPGWGTVFLLLISLGASMISLLYFGAHELLLQATQSSMGRLLTPAGHPFVRQLARNPFALGTVIAHLVAILLTLTSSSPSVTLLKPHHSAYMDKLCAFGISVWMFWCGLPAAKALCEILLQTAPTHRSGHVAVGGIDVEARLAQLVAHPLIDRVHVSHLWQPSLRPSHWVGTLRLGVKDVTDGERSAEEVGLEEAYRALGGVLGVAPLGRAELTVGVVRE
ncbi:hypothetical protein BZG36_01511 [Bifiguratus adelaidae]|uniref:Cation efflux protein transmembrane domain-containing protein n=1 Tax=Bifiguratus adelaidae TaxID=1938954 RepID=A0A261Y4U7_9FUNG|nr:hypothetical protein BZG36_01511 [Bifiguratus adelaidae]